jgi:hypothetical protein
VQTSPSCHPEAAAVKPAQNGPVAIVLGMHRSGTSLCASILHAAGIDMLGGANPLPNEANRKGHFERWEVVTAHRRILKTFGQGYDTLGALPPLWWREARLAGPVGELAAIVDANRNRGGWGFKDPRTMRLFRVWRELFGRMDVPYRLVLCLRQPWHVARSLTKRDGLSQEAGLALWLRYHVDFLTAQADLPWLVVDYDDWFTDPERTLAPLLDWTGAVPPPDAAARRELIARTVAPNLRRSSGPEAGPSALNNLYEAIRTTCQTRSAARENRRRLAANLRRACHAIVP